MKRAWEAVEREAWEEAEVDARAALAIRIAALGPDGALTANALGALAAALDGQQRYEESEALWSRVVSIRRRSGKSVELGDALDGQAAAREGLGRWEEAAPLRRESIAIGEADADDDTDYVEWRRFALAGNLVQQKHFAEAIALFETALPAIDDGSDERGFDLRAPLLDLAIALDDSGEDEKAIAIYRRIARIEETTLGPVHADLGWTLGSLGAALNDLGQSDEAIAILSRSLSIQTAIDPFSLASERAERLLGSVLLGLRSPDAIGHLRRAWEMRRDRSDATTDQTTLAAEWYSDALLLSGRFAEAEALQRSMLEDTEKAGDLAGAAGWATLLAVTLGRRYNWEQSEAFARHALQLAARSVRDVPRVEANAALIMGKALEQRAMPGVEDNYRRALTLFENLSPGDSRNVASALRTLGEFLAGTGRAKEAELLLARGLGMFERIERGESIDGAWTRLALARAVAANGRAEAASGLFERAVAEWRSGFPADHPFLVEALDSQARFELIERENASKARKLLKDAMGIMVARTRRLSFDEDDQRAAKFYRPTFALAVRAAWELRMD